LACCCDSIRWRGSRRALEEASQDSSSENSTNAGLVSAVRWPAAGHGGDDASWCYFTDAVIGGVGDIERFPDESVAA